MVVMSVLDAEARVRSAHYLTPMGCSCGDRGYPCDVIAALDDLRSLAGNPDFEEEMVSAKQDLEDAENRWERANAFANLLRELLHREALTPTRRVNMLRTAFQAWDAGERVPDIALALTQ